MHNIIQEKKCISLTFGPDKETRCLKWVLETIDFTQSLVSNILYRFYDFITRLINIVRDDYLGLLLL